MVSSDVPACLDNFLFDLLGLRLIFSSKCLMNFGVLEVRRHPGLVLSLVKNVSIDCSFVKHSIATKMISSLKISSGVSSFLGCSVIYHLFFKDFYQSTLKPFEKRKQYTLFAEYQWYDKKFRNIFHLKFCKSNYAKSFK